MSNLLTNDFQPSSSTAWKQKIQFELNGADYNKTLLTQTNEGITIKPFYHSDNFEKIMVPATKNNFNSCQTIKITTEETANLEALSVIEKGVNALKFDALKPFDFNTLFQNLLHKNIEFHFSFGLLSESFIQELCAFLNAETLYLNIDIIGNFAQTGNWFSNFNNDFKSIEQLIQTNPAANILSVNVGLYQNAGANIIQQVAYALAHANEYFNKFGGNIANNIQFNFAIGNNYFFEIAKIRAFRYLLNLVLTAYQTTVDVPIFAEPSFRNKSSHCYNCFVQRASTEFMSGIIGGAHTISNNVTNKSCLQNLINLKEEFSTKNRSEITEGNYYIESLTKQIAEKALIVFKEIEKGGGFLQLLKEGTIQRKINESAQKEQHQFNTGALVLVESNTYTSKNDTEKLDYFNKTSTTKTYRKTVIIPIKAKRLAEKLEQK
ncbi:methylmalonyl-CoA mutase family protein [Lutibacter maritimus]|uniref:Heterodimeric methylmalonyl-CoA mutase small subunit n=1 Tax=Lutibacter maritimus TaxID=593133 RepID=A0A1I6R3W8_9FLAO|nr:methylmalonyl-CoA mutase family protein [Lutibacter maritimus]SFS59369.1 heterodimeric methylmalonyl-CoA mutase small subunit [Lutibacter maritimus]